MKKAAIASLVLVLLTGAASAQETNSAAAANTPAAEAAAPPPDLYVVAGVDRDVVMPGKTFLKGYAGYTRPSARRGGGGGGAPGRTGPAVTVAWSKASGPGLVTFADEGPAGITATFHKRAIMC
jgi:hypothetical protein